MGAKSVIASVLMLSLVLAQVQVEATTVCCPSTEARNEYSRCRLPLVACAKRAGCIIQSSSACVPPFDHETLENSGKLNSLVLAQVQVEAKSAIVSCCPSTEARSLYDVCRATPVICAKLSGCILQSSGPCVPPNIHETLENSGDHSVNAYCKLGCSSSVCNPITSLQTSGEFVNEAVEKCASACSEFCTQGSIGARGNYAN